MKKINQTGFLCLLLVVVSVFSACKSGPFNLIKAGSPHQQYERKLINSGLNQTSMGSAWINNSQKSLQQALPIKLPYQEKGYFAADQPAAVAFKFNVVKGQRIKVQLIQKPVQNFRIYFDIWERSANQELKLITAADTLGSPIQLDADQTGELILRVQPELLGAGEYTLSVNTGPSLGYPLKAANRNQIQSLYGVGRDDNTRKHEGVDIFAPFRTPVVAVAPGTVTRVNTNNLGGKVVWLRPDDKNFTLYYAHLDEQTVTEGQRVLPGDTLGRMGNTGNARTTPPHLHFGIYGNGGTDDPLPYINPEIPLLPKINVEPNRLNTTMRTAGTTTIGVQELTPGTVLQVNAATGNEYRVQLPNGEIGYVAGKILNSVSKPIQTYTVKNERAVYDRPDTAAAVKLNLKSGQRVDILGSFGNFQLMVDENKASGWIVKPN